MFETTDNEILSKMTIIAKEVGIKIKNILKSGGFNININNGKLAGQEIMHTHFHVLQRFDGDGIKLWPANENEKQKVEKIYQTIINNIN